MVVFVISLPVQHAVPDVADAVQDATILVFVLPHQVSRWCSLITIFGYISFNAYVVIGGCGYSSGSKQENMEAISEIMIKLQSADMSVGCFYNETLQVPACLVEPSPSNCLCELW